MSAGASKRGERAVARPSQIAALSAVRTSEAPRSPSSSLVPTLLPASPDDAAPQSHPAARLLGVGTTRPRLRRSQQEVCEEIAGALGLRGADRTRWERIWRGTGIDARHACLPLDAVIDRTTAERMRLFHEHATPLAAEAARRALDDAQVDAASITDLVIVTCTGFSAPGLPRTLSVALGLEARVRSVQVGFMGCFGGVCGLRTAAAHALLEPGATVLLVCVELCSLHLRRDRDPQNLVASALFADGAAAAVLASPRGGVLGDGREGRQASSSGRDGGAPPPRAPFLVLPGRSATLPGTIDAMSWTITDSGFAMTLSREVPDALAQALPALLPHGATVILHPGGPAIIDAIESAIPRESASALDHARAVLREGGNMSSASVLFVLDRWVRSGGAGPAAVTAFGPGLTIDLVALLPCRVPP